MTKDIHSETITTTDHIAWVNIIMLAMLAAFGPFCTDLYLPALPAITRELNTDAAAIQLTLTTSFLGLALGQLFIGPISDAYGRKRPLYLSLIVFALSSIACALAPNITFLIIARFFQGLAGAGGIVLSRAIACDLYQGARLTQFMSLLMTVNSLAPILGPICGSLIATHFDWPALFLFLALWGSLLLLASFKAIDETLPPDKRSPQIKEAIFDLGRELKNPPFMCLALALSLISGAFFGYLAASPFIFQEIFGLTPFEYSLVFGLNAVCVTVGANVAAWLARRIPERKIASASILIMLLAPLGLLTEIIFALHSFYLVAVSLALFIVMNGAAQSTGFTEVMAVRQGGAGAATGLFGVLTFLFGALTAPLVGLMGETSMAPLMLVMLVCSVGAFILFKLGLIRSAQTAAKTWPSSARSQVRSHTSAVSITPTLTSIWQSSSSVRTPPPSSLPKTIGAYSRQEASAGLCLRRTGLGTRCPGLTS